MIRLLALLIVLGVLEGCAAVALTAGGIAGGAGVDHTLSGISYKTFAEPMNRVRLASLRALDKMAMPVKADKKNGEGDGWIIEATANDRTIEIELERLTPRATRMRVVANQGDIFFKDAATSTEIIVQTAVVLQKRPMRATAQK